MSNELKQALIAFVAVAAAVTGLVQLDVEVPFIGNLGAALVAVTFLYTPAFIAWRRKEELVTYGFVSAPLGRGLAIGVGIPLLVFPLFIAAYLGFYTFVCDTPSLHALAPPGVCPRFSGWDGLSLPAIDGELVQYAMVQLIVVALPEELFFRGCLLHLLEKAIPPRRRIWGGGIGWALLISAVMFALIHLPRDGDARALATFFPGLLFGWMRSATGSILAPTIAHAGSNVLVRVLDRMVLL